MDSDSELLELAAKAAGEAIDRWAQDENGVEFAWLENGDPWQPLQRNTMTDCMGDAMRLAVKLGIHITNSSTDAWATTHDVTVTHPIESDPYAATRRAIVRAAAELGREPGCRNG